MSAINDAILPLFFSSSNTLSEIIFFLTIEEIAFDIMIITITTTKTPANFTKNAKSQSPMYCSNRHVFVSTTLLVPSAAFFAMFVAF